MLLCVFTVCVREGKLYAGRFATGGPSNTGMQVYELEAYKLVRLFID